MSVFKENTTSHYATSALDALDQIMKNDMLIKDIDLISSTIVKIENSLNDKMALYENNGFRYYLKELESPLLDNIKGENGFTPLRYLGEKSFYYFANRQKSMQTLHNNQWASSVDEMKSAYMASSCELFHTVKFCRYFLNYGRSSSLDEPVNGSKKARINLVTETVYGFVHIYIPENFAPICADVYLMYKNSSTTPLCETKLKPYRSSGFIHLADFLKNFEKSCTHGILPQKDEFDVVFENVEIIGKEFATPQDLIEYTRIHMIFSQGNYVDLKQSPKPPLEGYCVDDLPF